MADILYLKYFPRLHANNHSVTSPCTYKYNCIAWAADSQDKPWWPEEKGYWPENAQRERTLEAFTEMFNGLGYEECPSEELEDGYEKVAIYARSDMKPTHAARQLANGQWTSKLGPLQDVQHEKAGNVNCDVYGTPVRFMQRFRK